MFSEEYEEWAQTSTACAIHALLFTCASALAEYEFGDVTSTVICDRASWWRLVVGDKG